MDQIDFEYVGTELELFKEAKNWKSYFVDQCRDFLEGPVLEVGAGLGYTTAAFKLRGDWPWTCLEPDPELVNALQVNLKNQDIQATVVHGTLASLNPDQLYKTILYIDVLEHIESDSEELLKASKHLQPGGRIIVLSPAFQILYSPFDKAIGHFRRYEKSTIRKIIPERMQVIKLRYLDSLGAFLNLGNRYVRKAQYPRLSDIYFWDKLIIPISRYLDYLMPVFGRSILFIIQKQA